jgi:hypothetical protein
MAEKRDSLVLKMTESQSGIFWYYPQILKGYFTFQYGIGFFIEIYFK